MRFACLESKLKKAAFAYRRQLFGQIVSRFCLVTLPSTWKLTFCGKVLEGTQLAFKLPKLRRDPRKCVRGCVAQQEAERVILPHNIFNLRRPQVCERAQPSACQWSALTECPWATSKRYLSKLVPSNLCLKGMVKTIRVILVDSAPCSNFSGQTVLAPFCGA